ncbi:MAG: ParB/RepB/Spo0J family partition protein, partial [Symbiobacteriaceae bacterium]|nr:ParB/RepB/Spo0J family partition protein [Symbiobacteriaceae bacterium]
MPAKTNRGLGRGLDALLRPETGDRSATEIQNIPLERIFPNRFQPRRSFEESGLQELAASIRSNGILEPILLRPLPDGFELVAGERRWRAAKLAGLTEIPSIVRYYDDRQTAEIALIENLQREDLNPIEEAGALQRLMQEFSLTQEEIARRIGRSRPYVANSLRLLQLPPRIQDYLLQGALEMGHARAMLPLATEMQLSLAAESIARKLTVRQIEARVR